MLFYRQQALAYVEATRSINMNALYARFLPHLPPRGTVLDAGCGSGRDTLAFKRMGFNVVAFDASPELAALASAYADEPVRVMGFDSPKAEMLALGKSFDGIWACASLLHVPEIEQPHVWSWLWSLLRPGGVMYASYKLGQVERTDEQGRQFTDADEKRLLSWLSDLKNVSSINTWQTLDQRPGDHQAWLNALVRKESGAP